MDLKWGDNISIQENKRHIRKIEREIKRLQGRKKYYQERNKRLENNE
jgi:hypothetical protein